MSLEINRVYNEDCIGERGMALIADGSVDMVQDVIKLYTEDMWTLRRIADKHNTDHHRIKRILTKNGIKTTREGRSRKEFTDEHRRKISEAAKGRPCWSKGKKMSTDAVYKNMLTHLQWDVELEWLQRFDIDKLKILNKMLSRKRDSATFDTDKYMAFVEKFYDSKCFNDSYDLYIKHNRNSWFRPSLDHIIPVSKGGTYDLDNLQVLTWAENRAKCNMNNDEWNVLVEIIKERY